MRAHDPPIFRPDDAAPSVSINTDTGSATPMA
jgi:hypothetical protein